MQPGFDASQKHQFIYRIANAIFLKVKGRIYSFLLSYFFIIINKIF